MNRPRDAVVECYSLGPESVRPISADDAAPVIRAANGAASDNDEHRLVWIDITAPQQAEATFLREDLGLHALAVEDCMRGRQRPKIDAYPNCSFVVFYAARINRDRDRVALNEIHLFIGPNYVITVHDHPIVDTDLVRDIWQAVPHRWANAIALSHAILDRLVDGYFPLIEHFSSRIEGYEEFVFSEAPDFPMKSLADLRREMIHFRRVLSPERDLISTMIRREVPMGNPDMVHYFQDVHDHILRVTEEMDSLRDLMAGLIEIQASHNGRQLNETMQTLTAWSIILMTMALIAGIYGMNFMFMPELGYRWGYLWALALMAVLGVALVGYFRRKGWL